MKIALIGYGKMGKAIEKIALERGHQIVCKIDLTENGTFDSAEFASADVAIEFSTPQTAFDNYLKCFEHKKPVVSGTTGWLDKLPIIKDKCKNEGQTFFYASNFSLGVNLFFEVNRHLAQLMNKHPEYAVEVTETHHIHKLDAPSGTAITIANGIIDNLDRKNAWTLAPEEKPDAVKITALREGEVPGIHTIKYNSEDDFIEITHSAYSRRGFAFGAVLVAEFIQGKQGFLGMKELLGL